ncbi:MAG TPA: hypothetical protein VJB15_03955 [Rhodothermia bacterium]|nr:hypothetical protein [Rhodothermia bacterium]
MKCASRRAIGHIFACFAAGALTPCLGTAQVALPGEQDPTGRVYTQIVARVGEQGSNSPPIAGLTVYVVSEDGRRVILRTNRGGTAAIWLARAQYRIVTPDPFQLEGRLYTWDTLAAVRPGMAPIRLQLANAKSREVPVVRWRPDDASSGQTLRDGRTVRTLSRDGVVIAATIIRSDDLMWIDVSVSNGSSRKLDVDPQAFTLDELSPNQTPLRYVIPTEDILNRALTANTLMPGQKTSGTVFFEGDKKARELVLRIPLTGVTFEVPLTIR